MPKLDFSALNQLAYRGFDTEEARADKDALIEKGFTVVEGDKDNPFTSLQTASQSASERRLAPPASTAKSASSAPMSAINAPTASMRTAARKVQNASQSVPQRTQRAFTAPTDVTRDYRAMYAALFRFHERHNPPIPGDDDGASYWTTAAEDIVKVARQFDDDPFMMDLLCAVYGELEREYKTIMEGGAMHEQQGISHILEC